MYQTESEALLNISGYTDYDQLESLEWESDTLDRVYTVQQNEQAWVEHFEIINYLRRVNKQFPNEFRQMIEQEFKDDQYYLLNSMSSWINSLRSNVQKNALILYKEIIQYNQIEDLSSQTLNLFLYKVLDKLDSDYKFLRQEATQSLELLNAKKYHKFEPTIIQALTNISLNQNKSTQKVSDQAYLLLSKTLQIMPFTQFHPIWLDIFKTTTQHAEGKSVECRDSAYSLVDQIQKKGQWEQALNYTSLEEPENKLQEALLKLADKKLKQTTCVKTNSFKNFMALKKQNSLVKNMSDE